MIQVYGMAVSGNCWKAAQILSLTGRAFDWIETDGNTGATRTPEYLAINPNGKVPAVVIDGGEVIVESNAILAHFADEGGFDLAAYPGVGVWLHRMAMLPGIVTLPRAA